MVVAAVVVAASVAAVGRLVRPTYVAEAEVAAHPAALVGEDPARAIRPGPIGDAGLIDAVVVDPTFRSGSAHPRHASSSEGPVEPTLASAVADRCRFVQAEAPGAVRVRATGPDAASAAALANAVAAAVSARRSDAAAAAHRGEVSRLRADAEAAAGRAAAARDQQRTTADGDDVDALAARQAAVAREANRYRALAEDLRRRLTGLEVSAQTTVTTPVTPATPTGAGGGNPAAELARRRRVADALGNDPLHRAAVAERVAAAVACWDHLSAGKTEEHRDVWLARQRMDRAAAAAADREREVAAAVAAAARDEDALAAAAAAERARAGLVAAAAELAGHEARLAALDREVAGLAGGRRAAQAARDAAGRAEAEAADRRQELERVERAGVAAAPPVRWADPSAASVRDPRPLATAGSVAGGLLAGAVWCGSAAALGRRVRRPDEVRALLGAPVLGAIVDARACRGPEPAGVRAELTDGFRDLRDRILFGPTPAGRVIGVTSPSAGDGRTSVATGLALSLAGTGRRVLLVGADLDGGGGGDDGGPAAADPRPGLGDVLRGAADPADAIRPTHVAALDELMPGRGGAGAAADLLARPAFGWLIEGAVRGYDHVVIDAPPLSAPGVAAALAGADAVLCCVPDRPRRADVSAAAGRAAAAGIVVAGVVLNRVPPTRPATRCRAGERHAIPGSVRLVGGGSADRVSRSQTGTNPD